MKIEKTTFPGLLIIHPDVYGDGRGWFTESYNQKKYQDLGINVTFIQDNHSYSAQKGTLRGLHFQTGDYAQSKLVRCVSGRLWDVVVDLRKNSPTYKKYLTIELSTENHLQLFVPKGFAHGFVTLSDHVEIEYKVDAFYSKEHDGGIRYDDPEINIDYSNVLEGTPVLSDKDLTLKYLKDQSLDFVYVENE